MILVDLFVLFGIELDFHMRPLQTTDNVACRMRRKQLNQVEMGILKNKLNRAGTAFIAIVFVSILFSPRIWHSLDIH